MTSPLFGDPYQLQGSSGQSLQGGYGGNLQPAGNPQAAYAPVPATRPAPAPVATRQPATTRRAAPAPRVAPAPTLDPSGLVGSLYSPYIGARPSPSNPSVAEFYRKDTGQALDQQGLFNYANSLGFGQVSSFDHLKAQGYVQPQAAGISTPQAQQPVQIDPNQSLAEAAAQAGLSLDDYLKLVSSQYGLSPEEKASINQKLGIPDLESQVFAPAPQTEQLYQDVYNTAGLGNIKAKIDAKLKEINDLNSKYTEAAGRINENPWLSEASLTGRLRILDEKRQAEIRNLNNEAQQLQDLYNNGVNEVHNLVSMQSQDFSNNQQLNQQKLSYLLSKAEQQTAEAEAKKSAGAYQYLPDYLKAKAKAQKPDTIGSESTGYYRWNPDTGTFEQVIAPYVKPENELDNAKKILEIQKLQQELTDGGTNDLDRQYKMAQLQKLQQEIVQGVNGKPPTDAQNTAAGYATRIDQSSSILDQLEGSIAGYNIIGFKAQQKAPNNLKSSQIQQYEQAARNFINVVLRRESGAAIAQSEFDNAYQQYLPYPGDSAQVLAQKKANRDTVLNSLKQAAGPAYNSGGGVDASDPLGLFKEKGGGIAPVISQKYPDGYAGGQCGDFAHKLVNFPPVGDSKTQKIAAVQKYGIPAEKWRQDVHVGDVIITGENPTYGHVAVVNAILPNGKIQLSESNFKQSNKVSNDRVISVNSSQIYGAIRGSLKIA